MLPLKLLVAALVSPDASVPAAGAGATDATTLMQQLAGSWACSGGFASGKPLAADLRFELSANGLGVRFMHIDHAPNRYRQEAQWGFDKDSGKIVSLAFTASSPGVSPTAAMYVADSWTGNSVTLVHKPLLKDPFAPNRFTYTVDGDRLRKLWEVVRSGDEWKMGDYLDCTRIVP